MGQQSGVMLTITTFWGRCDRWLIPICQFSFHHHQYHPFCYIKLMSFIFSIDEQDSLLEHSQMKMFINSNKRQSLLAVNLRPSLTLQPTLLIPNKLKEKNVKIGFSPSKLGTFRSQSETAFSRNSFSSRLSRYQSGVDPVTLKKTSLRPSSNSKTINRIIQQSNRNLQSTMHKINVKTLLALKSRHSLPFETSRRQSLLTLKPKNMVQFERKMNKKYSLNCPFEPSYLQSEYLT